MIYSSLIVFLFLHFSVSAQILKGVVIDSLTKDALAYANLSLKDKKIGVYSDENGFYLFELSKDMTEDSLVISLIGYEKQIVPVIDFLNEKDYTQSFQLLPKTERLEEVIVFNNTSYSSKKTKLSTGGKKRVFPSSVPFGYEIATYVENKKSKKGKIIEFNLRFKESIHNDIKIYKTFYRIKFYKVDVSVRPSELLDYENIIIKPPKDLRSYTINLEYKDIEFDENGIFVGIETINPNNEKPETTMYLTTPNILYTHSKSNCKYTRFGTTEWTKNNRKSVFKKQFYTIPLLKLKVVYEK